MASTLDIDPDRLFRTRLAVARFGEMDHARWWNTNGQLGKLGSVALRRGFPRTHFFAQARSVFAVASQRCREVFDPPGCVTLWNLPESIEEEFDTRWDHWVDHREEWASLSEKLELLPQDPPDPGLPVLLRSLGLVTERDFEAYATLRTSAEGRAVPIRGSFTGSDTDVAVLALGFARSEVGALAVPYVRRADG